MKKNYKSINARRYMPSCGGIERTEQKYFLWTQNLLKNLAAKYSATG